MKLQQKVIAWTLALIMGISAMMPTAVYAAEESLPLLTEDTELEELVPPVPEEESALPERPETTPSTPEEPREEPQNDGSEPTGDPADRAPESEGTETGHAPEDEVEIQFDKIHGIHSVQDPDFPNQRIILYCMNNQLHWPHVTPDTPSVPHYTEGYLTPELFRSPFEYHECTRKLRKILFAGYPYNAERLYKIVESDAEYVPTEEEFNEMLVPLPQLTAAFPILGHHIFTLKDRHNQMHLNVLKSFIVEVKKLSPNGTTENGLTYQDITAMPFYKAAVCLTYEMENPLELFPHLFPNSYFVTEQQAYDSTQNAIWKLLYDYQIPDNNISQIEHDSLAKVLLQYAERGDLLQTEPEFADIQTEGELSFSYDPEDGLWHTGKLKIIEPENYHGIYDMSFPEGVTLLDSKLSHVYGNEEYELVSSRPVQPGEIFCGTASYYWMEAFEEYSPIGKMDFQHMVGALIPHKKMSFAVLSGTNELGDLTIHKTVVGEEADQGKEFSFQLTLPGHAIDGEYGDLEFQNGTAHFTLKDGETKSAKNLPAGAAYVVTEEENPEYTVQSERAQGTIAGEVTIPVSFTNTRKTEGGEGGETPEVDPPEVTGTLTIHKTVVGGEVDREKEFSFQLTLPDHPITGTYGDLEFQDGTAYFTLKDGETKSAKNLPAGAAYMVTEEEHPKYTVQSEHAQGTITGEATIFVSFMNTRKSEGGGGSGGGSGGRNPDVTPPKPIEPTIPTEPTAPTEPTVPTEPTIPTEPTVPTEPMVPQKPRDPQPPEESEVPKTGDDSRLGIWLGVLALSLTGLYYERRKTKERNAE